MLPSAGQSNLPPFFAFSNDTMSMRFAILYNLSDGVDDSYAFSDLTNEMV